MEVFLVLLLTVLSCAHSLKPDWELAEVNLYDLPEVSEGEMIDIRLSGREGLLFARLMVRDDTSMSKFGTVCDDYFNDHAANLSCQYLGYKFAEAWGSYPENFEFVAKSFLQETNLPIVVDKLQCDVRTTTFTQCEVSVADKNCNLHESLWLRCADEPIWNLNFAGLYYVIERDDGSTALEPVMGNEGLLFVSFMRGNRDGMSGTVCSNNFTDHAANLTCHYIGYGYAESWGSSAAQNSRYIPESFLIENNLKILVDDVRCNEWTTNITDCTARVMEEHDCNYSSNLWLNCQGEWEEDEEEEDDEKDNDEDDEDNEDDSDDDEKEGDDETGIWQFLRGKNFYNKVITEELLSKITDCVKLLGEFKHHSIDDELISHLEKHHGDPGKDSGTAERHLFKH